MIKLAFLAIALAPAVAHADKSFNKAGQATTWDCAKDPVVRINHGSGTYTFTGACTSIKVNGGNHTITIESVDELSVNSGGCTISVGTIGVLRVNGAGNTITWKNAKSGDNPETHVNGSGNKIDHAK